VVYIAERAACNRLWMRTLLLCHVELGAIGSIGCEFMACLQYSSLGLSCADESCVVALLRVCFTMKVQKCTAPAL